MERFSNVKLQLTLKRPTDKRIRSLLNIFILPKMETPQKI